MPYKPGEIYHLDNGNLLYYFSHNKHLYEIPKSESMKFNAFRQRFILTLAFTAVLYSFFPNQLLFSVGLGGIFYAFSTYVFFKKLLPGFLKKEKMERHELKRYGSSMTSAPFWTSILIVLIGIIIVVTAFFISQRQLDQVILILFGALLTVGGSHALISPKKH